MSETVRQSDLRNHTAEIMRRVAAGESFTITVRGRAVADLVPHRQAGEKRGFISAAEVDALLTMDHPAPEPTPVENEVTACQSPC